MKIFVSSTFVDLRPEREAVIEAILATKIAPRAMEFFASEPSTPREVALRELDGSDAVILLLGFKGGSLIPGSADLTYTAAEFERAMTRNMPIFVFIKTEDGKWKNEEADEPLKTILAEFKQRVMASPLTPAYFDISDKLKFEVVQALVNWNMLGRPGARKTFATPEEYFPKPAGPALFDYEQTFLGRSSESEALNAFLKTDGKRVSVVVGRGGIGKSKLIRHWVSTIADSSVLFLRDGAVWHEESDKEIPQGTVVIIADDAHHSAHLPELLSTIKVLSENRSIKLVLTLRPSSMSRIDSALTRRFDPSEVIRIKLEALTKGDVRNLAEEMLGQAYKVHAPALVELSSDTPLVTVVGGRLIARGAISADLLANEDDFRRAVFDKFVEEYERNLPQGPVDWVAVLQLIAALQPLRPRWDKFQQLAETFLKKRGDEILQAIDILEEHGLLLRGGHLVRIVPDVLGDYLLERACVNAHGETTGYATAIFGHFAAAFLSNILSNLGELDWRIAHKHASAPILDDIWKQFFEEFKTLHAAGRVHLLKSLKEAAVFQPEKTLQIIRFAIAEEATPLEQYGFTTSQKDVLDELPGLMHQVAFHPEHTEEMVRRLFELAAQDKNQRHQFPKAAANVLKSLAQYGRYKPVGVNDRVADIAVAIAKDPKAFDGEFTPLDLAQQLLAKEGEHNESEGYTIHLGSFPLNYPVLFPIRQKALPIVEECLNSTNPRAVKSALTVIAKHLANFLPVFGRQRAEDEIKWQDDERIEVLEMISRRLAKPLSLALQRELLRILRSARYHPSRDAVKEKAAAVIAQVKSSDELVSFDMLCANYWDPDHEHTDFQQAEREHLERVRRAAARFQELYPEPQEQIERLNGMLASASELRIDTRQSSANFVNVLCENAAFIKPFSDFLLKNEVPEMGHLMWCVLLTLRETDPDWYEAIALRAAEHSNTSIASSAANVTCTGPKSEDLMSRDAAILAKVILHPDLWVRRASFVSLGRLGSNPNLRKQAIDLLLKVEVGNDKKAADDLFRSFGPSWIDISSLSEPEVAGFLDKLIPVSELDDYWTEQFLGWAAENYASLVFNLLINRLERHQTMAEQSDEKTHYQPIPYADLGSAFRGIQKSAEYPAMLSKVRDLLFNVDILQRFWLRNLFWSLGSIDNATLQCLDEWLHSEDPEKVKAAFYVASEGPADIAFSRPAFAVHAVECAARISDELRDAAVGTFTANASKGMIHANPGEPPPRLVATKLRAEEFGSQYAPDSLGRQLFETIATQAEQTIERFRIDDEEFRFGRQ